MGLADGIAWENEFGDKNTNKGNNQFYPQILFFDENELGKIVRNAWIKWAKEQHNPKPSWLVPYEELSQLDKDADIRIGQAVVDICNRCITEILKNYKIK